MLANSYKARLSAILDDASAVTFVDLVPLLRALGTETFIQQLSAQKSDLLEFLVAADGKELSSTVLCGVFPLCKPVKNQTWLFPLCHSLSRSLIVYLTSSGFKSLEVEKRFEQAQQSLKQCRLHLEHLQKVWIDVLPSSNYCKSMGG